MTRQHLPHIDRSFDIDEKISDTQPRPPLVYGKRIDERRLVAVSIGGGWWNSTTQELIPILPEDHPDYLQNREIITEAISRWDRGK